MPKLTVNGIEVEVEPGATVLQACEAAGAEIPRFCYHERLSVAGNCRMCLVEMERAPKPVASCAMPAGDGMVISTDSESVKKARQGVMEFLLINHPLDCPICDQGGECDLQDQAMGYGDPDSRYGELKRSVVDKNMGPLVKTIMTRCIHCTRCVRFTTEVAGVDQMGLLNRGEDAEITTYLEQSLDSEMSGNVVDLCPVGALTSKPYAFAARPWELKKTETIDVMDAMGANIRVDARGGQVLRVLPRLHEEINEEWISDKTRHACDGLSRQRLDRPFVRRDGKLVPASWTEALAAVAARFNAVEPHEIAAIVGDQADAEAMFALKQLMDAKGVANLDCRQDGARVGGGARAGYVFNSGFIGVEEADALLLIGTNPRWEAPVWNARVRKRWLADGAFKVGLVGAPAPLTYDHEYLGAGAETLRAIAAGDHPFAEALKAAERPMLVIGNGALARADGAAMLALARDIAENYGLVSDDWNGFNVLHTAASRVGGLDLGLLPAEGGLATAEILAGAQAGTVKMVYLLGADEIDAGDLGDAFVVYQGHHGDRGAHRADVILPGAAYTEKDGLYVNSEGRVQMGLRAVFPPGEAREDWKILRALAGELEVDLGYDDLAGLRAVLVAQHPHFEMIDMQAPSDWGAFGAAGDTDPAPFAATIANFYQTDPISRASETMAQCTEAFVDGKAARTGTDG